MRNYEIGILPQSTCFYFSHGAATQKLFYYPVSCGHFYCTEEYYIKRTFYAPLLLVYVCRGTLCLDLERTHYEATAGQVLFFDCQTPHHYYARGDTEFYYLHFDGPVAHELCRYINKASGVRIVGAETEAVRRALADMIALYENDGSESIVAGSARIYQMAALLDNPTRTPRLQKNDDSIVRAIAYIRTNIGKKITLHELAEISGLSDYYFSHVFKEMTGLSPSTYILNCRIDQAKALLASTPLSIAEIAQEVGYPNSGNLIALFMQRVGCSPTQFRNASLHGD